MAKPRERKIIMPTAAEDRAINAGIAADPDTYEVPAADFKKMRPFRLGRPPSDTHKERVTMRLDPEILEYFRAPGAGWQTRLNAFLAAHVKRASKPKRRSARSGRRNGADRPGSRAESRTR